MAQIVPEAPTVGQPKTPADRAHAVAAAPLVRRSQVASLRAEVASLRAQNDRLLELLQAAERQARRDPLTDLLNRAGLDDGYAFAQGSWELALIDLDGFKQVNDTHGHAAGDALLTAVADSLREYPIAARLGGDEFVVVGRLLGGVARHWPVQLPSGEVVCVSASVGVTRVVIGDLAATLRQADAAMYRAKKAAPGSLLSYDADLDDRPVHPRPRVRLRDREATTR
ncbi:GGDEF domain-containing protein [Verrucosispora sp. TAA-831]|uniref:GGDEF domain-containing protein n=1 Tax=Verrucosispora sp. TAA-831 TaxID=3422227 RepID=UPI003D6DD30C